ncbi:MAG: hypothetical protein D8H99_48500 [Streptococcus sp.]|nr:MAG: hypothetical protein D8H99_48500 [Streptococcus sp.]
MGVLILSVLGLSVTKRKNKQK